jgi:hypothetical protein
VRRDSAGSSSAFMLRIAAPDGARGAAAARRDSDRPAARPAASQQRKNSAAPLASDASDIQIDSEILAVESSEDGSCYLEKQYQQDQSEAHAS